MEFLYFKNSTEKSLKDLKLLNGFHYVVVVTKGKHNVTGNKKKTVVENNLKTDD